jgi:hypothetical protein|tara:strand:- start:200 stop:529 length:330 start_codon:yes stop_codon:yes gene_type:complete
MDVNIDNILQNLKSLMDDNIIYMDKILSINDKKLQKKEIELLSNISTDINNLNIRINEFYHNILNYSSQEKTTEEKIKIRDDYINNKIQEILLPYMIYMKIVLQNNDSF